MADITELQATVREGVGKGASRAIRRQGRVPAVIYGGKAAPEPISLDYKELWQQVQTGHFLSTVYMLNIGGKKIRAIPRDVQFDPVRDFVEHVDFLRVSKTSRLDVEVPINVINEEASPGLKRGGALNIVRHEIELSCPADAIPEMIEVDVTGLEIGDSLHISQIRLPEDVTPTITDRDFTILTIAGASAGGAEAEEEQPEEAAEEEGE